MYKLTNDAGFPRSMVCTTGCTWTLNGAMTLSLTSKLALPSALLAEQIYDPASDSWSPWIVKHPFCTVQWFDNSSIGSSRWSRRKYHLKINK